MSDVIPKQIWVVGDAFFSGCYGYHDMYNEHPRYFKTITVNGENRELEINYDRNRRNAGWHIGDGLHGYMNPADSYQVPLEGWQVFGCATTLPTLQYQPPPEKSTTVTNFTIEMLSTDIGELGKDLTLEVFVDGQGEKPSPANTRLVICENDYWQSFQVGIGSIGPGAGGKVSIKLKAKSTASVDTLPERFEVRLVSKVEGSDKEEEKVLHKQDIVLSMSQVYTGLSKIRPDPESLAKYFNILFMGPKGTGKSSLMLTALTTASASRSVRHGLVKISNLLDHVTLDVTRYPLDDGIPAQISDVPGYTLDDYNWDVLDALLDGLLPDSWRPGKPLKELLKDMVALQETSAEREIHVVVLFVACEQIQSENPDERLTREREDLIKHLLKRNIAVVVMLTRADVIETTIGDHPLAPGDALSKCIQKAENMFGVPVYYTVNYVKQKTRSFDMDRLCYKNLEAILNCAKQHLIRRKLKQSN